MKAKSTILLFSSCLALVIQFVLATPAHAAKCTITSGGVINLNIGESITLNPSKSTSPTETVLYSRQFPVSAISYTCENGATVNWQSAYSRSYAKSVYSNIYITEVAGIGIRMKWPASFSDAYYVPGKSLNCIEVCTIPADNVLVELVHIGSVAEGEHIISAGEIAKAYIPTDSGEVALMHVNLGSNIVIKPKSCAVVPSSTFINLGTYDSAYFSKSTKQGEEVKWNFHVSCPTASSIGLTFNSDNYLFGAETGEIGVISGEGYAKNISVKVKINEKSTRYSYVQMGKKYLFPNVVEKNINMSAHLYVKDSERANITPGKVSGTLLYTISID